MSTSRPGPSVLRAFGLEGIVERLPGGGGTSWRVGGAVLKPGGDPSFQRWLGTELASVVQDGFRLPTVLQTGVGDWVHQGWGALTVLPGASTHEGTPDWRAVITAGRALHRATAGMPRPSLLDSRTDAWAVADRLAWDETLCGAPPDVEDCLARLRAALVQPDEAAQVVHGDLTTNVLTAPGQVPSIIDFSPYWRPPSYAEGIVIADALCWYAPVPHLHDKLDVPLAAVARGLLFRLLTTIQGPHAPAENDGAVDLSRYKNAMDVLHL